MTMGCYKTELESATKENSQLRTQVKQLTEDVKKLENTAEHHFRTGKDQFDKKKWGDAIASFNTVIEKYPTDPLVANAKVALDEVNQAEAEADAQRQKEFTLSGEPIYYKEFYVKTRTGIKNGKRYRFIACLDHAYNAIKVSKFDSDHTIVGVAMSFDERMEFERLLSGPSLYCGTIVAALLDGQVTVYRLH
jgi:hypothetical protein